MFYVLFVVLIALCLYCAIKDIVNIIDLSNIVKVTISSPTLSQGVSRICQ